MDHDDDVEHLFSWLQTPDLRYREFAGAREITDTVATSQILRNTANGVAPEAPAAAQPAMPAPLYTAAAEPEPPSPEVRSEPVKAAPFHRPFGAPAGAPAGPPLPTERGVFALGASGRPAATTPSPTLTSPMPPLEPRPAPTVAPGAAGSPAAGPVPRETQSVAAAAQPHGLLGGAYRPNGAHGPSSGDPAKHQVRPLDAVFSRLAGRARLPDPHDRLRRLPGLGPPGSRSR
jgi:hypothetical protein